MTDTDQDQRPRLRTPGLDPTHRPPTSGVPMDPRIRQRRLEVRRDEGRHRLRVLVGCLSVAGLVAAAVGAARSPLFDVDYVDVRGAEETARLEVVGAGRLDDRPAMLDVDTAGVARRVEALPWVLDARARRRWPGSVRVDIVERRAVAVVPAGDGIWAVADAEGRVLAAGPEKPPGLPVVGNQPPAGRPGTSLPSSAVPSLKVAAALSPELRARVADVATTSGGEVELQLVPPGGVVRLGRSVDLALKLDVLATVLARADLGRVAVIDVRVPRAPALTRR